MPLPSAASHRLVRTQLHHATARHNVASRNFDKRRCERVPAALEGETTMEKRLLTLALGMFALGTDTFVVAGVLPQIARSFHVDVAVAGQLTTLYAIAYALLAPTAAAVAASVPRKQLMLSGLGIFMLANLTTALAPTFMVALISRVFAGLGAALYAPTATSTGAMIVAPERRGQALATIVAGLTAATAL